MAFTYYRLLSPNPVKISGVCSNFVALVNLTDATLKSVANGGHVQSANGYDIAFGDGSVLYKFELISYTATTGALLAWVKIPVLRTETTFYIHYGDASITTNQSDAANTWSGFVGVYHFGDGVTLNLNSSTGSNNGTNHGATAVAGIVPGGGGVNFAAASSQYVDLGTGINPAAVTYSCWVKPASFPAAYAGMITRANAGYTAYTLFDLKSTGKLVASVMAAGAIAYDGTGANTLATGTWYHVAMTYDAVNGLKGYFNGNVDGTAGVSGGLNTTVLNTLLGTDINTAGRYYDGSMDEARIANVALSPSYIFAEYNNQATSSTFFTLGSESTGTPPIIPPLVTLINATTGYPDDIADWADTTPQPNSASSGASIGDWPLIPAPAPVFDRIGHTLAYDTIADFFDTTPQPDFAASGASYAVLLESGYGIMAGFYYVEAGVGIKEKWGIVGE